jgi:ADP-ribose pyrophosphatase YjhB (NUDIX family)
MMFVPKKLPYEEFKKIYSKVPRLCVDLIIKSDEGILLAKREIEPFKDYWHFPGGTVLFGEKVEETIKRVSEEETGLKLKVLKLLGIMEFPIYNKNNHTVSLVYLTKPIDGKLRGCFQAKELKYFKTLPPQTIKEQVDFWKKFKLEKGINYKL